MENYVVTADDIIDEIIGRGERERGKLIEVIEGMADVEIPSLCNFVNSFAGIQMVERYIHSNNSNIIIHCDVDMDGIGVGYELKKFFEYLGYIDKVSFIINKEKEHGIQRSQVEYLNKCNQPTLLIIVDSSCNELDIIQRYRGDVLVIDHHKILHDKLVGKTINGEYIIVTNMVDNLDTSINSYLPSQYRVESFKRNSNMSCGLVVYEWLRIYQLVCGISDIVERGKLYQWAAITLFTDNIQLANFRNQWYVSQLSGDRETTLQILVDKLNIFNHTLDKNFISFQLAPRVNKAIRAGASREALQIILHSPQEILELDKYKEAQEKALENVEDNLIRDSTNGYIFKDLTNSGVSRSYCGVIAAKLKDIYYKDAIVGILIENTNIYSGSFRGLRNNIDYLGYFEEKCPGIFAQGHEQAFGFKANLEQLDYLMKGLIEIEKKSNSNMHLVTAEDIPEELRGKFHINSLDKFRKQQGLLKLAIANSRLSSDESIEIILLNTNNFKYTQRGKLYKYDIYGIECKAFEILKTQWVRLYIEYIGGIEIFVRNM